MSNSFEHVVLMRPDEVISALESLHESVLLDRKAFLATLSGSRQALTAISDSIKAGSSDVAQAILGNVAWIPMLCTWLDLDLYTANSCSPPHSNAEEVLREVCHILGQLALLSEYRASPSAGQTPHILSSVLCLLRQLPLNGADGCLPPYSTVARRACETITSLSHENKDAKQLVHGLEGIPPLVRLLRSLDTRVQRASAAVLRTLAFKEEPNKVEIVRWNALPPLIEMLRSEDSLTHYESVGTLGNLVHSSQDIKKQVLRNGALQPVINLLQSPCRDSQREAALLVGQFAQYDNRAGPAMVRRYVRDAEDYRVKIVQRGAVPPLIAMLQTNDRALKEMAAFALGRLAQNVDNQAGIFAMGALQPLLDLLCSGARNLEHNAAFAIYGLADNPDNAPEIIKQGGYEQLRLTNFRDGQPTKDCVLKTLKRLAEKVQKSKTAKWHLMPLLRCGSHGMRQRVAASLAHLLQPDDVALAYTFYGGLGVLLDMVFAPPVIGCASPSETLATAALNRVVAVCQEREASMSSAFIPSEPEKKVFIDPSYVNNPSVHDVVFVVEGRPFYAHKLALSASSEAFLAMFESDCLEGTGGIARIEIPHIKFEIFNAMMLFIYTGELGPDLAPDAEAELLRAADQYLLDKLKRACEEGMARRLTPDNVLATIDLAHRLNAQHLLRRAVAHMVLRRDELNLELHAAPDLSLIRHVLEEYVKEVLWTEPAPEAEGSATAVEAAAPMAE